VEKYFRCDLMNKINKNQIFFLSVIAFLCILNLALYLRIPVILPITGLIALCIAPGYLLCLLFRIQVTDPLENFLYSIGISIIFDLLFGLAINTILPILGDTTPLSAKNLQISYSGLIFVLTALIVYTGRAPVITPQLPKFGRLEKLLLIFGLIVLVSSETGIYLINMNMTNYVLIFSIFLIPLLLLLCIIYHENVCRIYPVLLVLIGTSLTMIFALRSNYVFGVDINEEYHLFFQTLTQLQWIPDPTLLLGSSVSISILPVVFENILHIYPQILYKLLFPLLFLIVPLIIYTIVKKFFSELLALFAACFYMFQNYFVGVSQIARTSVAILFYSFCVMVLYDKELIVAKKYALLLLFITGGVFSHYSSSFAFLFILLLAYLLDLVLTRQQVRRENRLINFTLIIFFLSLILFWYDQIINAVFNNGLTFTVSRSHFFVNLTKNEITTSLVPAYIPPLTLLARLINYSRLALFAFIGVGIVFALYRVIAQKSPHSSGIFRSGGIGCFMISMGCISTTLLYLTVFASALFEQYETGRTQALLFVILPLFLITGVFAIVNWGEILLSTKNFFPQADFFSRFPKEKIGAGILLMLLVPLLLSATYISNEFTGGPYNIALNSPRYSIAMNPIYEDPAKFSYIYDQDATALGWFNDHSYNNVRIYSDPFGNKKIGVFVNRRSVLYQKITLPHIPEEDAPSAYIFLSFANGYFGEFRTFRNQETELSAIDWLTDQKNRIFSNGAVIYQ
jgi:uncharacterized membrane protein